MKILISIHLLALIILTSFSTVLFADQSGINAVINYTQSPRNLQFFARDTQDSSNVTYAGTLYTTGYDSIYIEVYRNNVYQKRKSAKLTYVSGIVNFSISQKIHSELSEYKVKLFLKTGATATLMSTADSLVSGDAYLICGQSNSHPTDPTATYTNEFCRSFGVQTPNYNADNYNPADTAWGLSKSNGAVYTWSGPNNVGVWGLTLQKLIRNNFGIPTCIINGGRASTSIQMQLRNNSAPEDLTSIYGKTFYRVKKSGLANSIKAIFWYQGESNGDLSWMSYASNFQTLYNSWKENYPGFKKIFLFQTRPCCSERYASELREVQRKLPLSYPDIELLATAGMPEYGGCHYSANGYYKIADMVYRPLAKYFYSISDTLEMRPPNVKAVYYTTAAKNEIAVVFANSKISVWPSDTLGQSMKNYFFLNGAAGNISTGVISGDTLKLRLISPSSATKLTYLPTVWTIPDSVVYEGPFLRNSRGLGALSFHDFPISNYAPVTLNVTMVIDGYFNTTSNRLNIRDTVSVYLRNNYYPYLIRDSSRAVVDSVSFTGAFKFMNITAGNYYIVVKGRNSLETWSKSGGAWIGTGATVSYNFTTALSQAYGNNLKIKGGKFCIYNSDVNKDGNINLHDNMIVCNDALYFLHGFAVSDINGDRMVDLNDINFSFNILTAFISKKRPY